MSIEYIKKEIYTNYAIDEYERKLNGREFHSTYSNSSGVYMARMIPDSFDYSETKSGGEERVYDALKEKLNDEWLVYHSWRWLKYITQQGSGKYQGEGDFVLFHPNCGIIVIEVKGGTIEFRNNGKYYSNGNLITNPEKQASDTKFDIIDRLKEKKLNKICWVGHCVWFPDILWTDKYPPNMNSTILLDQTALSDPETFLVKVNISKSSPIRSNDDIEIIEKIIHRPFILVKSLKFKIEDTIKEQVRLTQQQEQAFELLKEVKCIGIKGRAGTGKTLLAVNKAKKSADNGENVLFLCFNRGLADFLSFEMKETKVDIFTFHRYAKDYLEKYYPHRALGSPEDQNYFNHIAHEFSEVIDENRDQYSTCIIDEAQDLNSEWFIALKETFYPKLKFFYFFDPLQVPYTKKIELEESHFNFGVPIIPLERNMRNTCQVSQSSLNILKVKYNPTIHFSSLDGDYPEIILVRSELPAEVHTVLNSLKIIEHLNNDDITILSMKGEGNSELGYEFEGHKIVTFRKFKGLDNKVILIVDIDFKHFEDEVYEREFYMAITRSKYLVYLFINNQDSLMKQSFCQKLNVSNITTEKIKSYLEEKNYE